MGIRSEMSFLLEEEKANKKKLEKDKKDAKKKLEDAKRKEIEDRKSELEATKESYIKFKKDVRNKLFSEALTCICTQSINNPTDTERRLMKNIVTNYVVENGALSLINNSRHPLMVDVKDMVNEYYSKLIENADETNIYTHTIDPITITDFFKDLDKLDDIEDATGTIRARVAMAEEEFVTKNTVDKQNIDTVLKDTNERIKSAKEGLDNNYSEEVADEVAQEAAKLGKEKIYRINKQPKNLFHEMVTRLAKSALNDEVNRQRFVNENSRLDMFKITESVRCMYTMLEAVSTLKIENVDEKYIKNVLESI